MAIQFIHIGKFTSKEVHLRIIDSVFGKALGPEPTSSTFEDEKNKFSGEYRTALKTSLAALAVFMIEKGRDLLTNDTNNYYLYIQCIGLYLSEAKPEEKETIVQEVVKSLKTELKEYPALYIKILSFLFSCLEPSNLLRLQLFEEIVKECRASQKEYLFMPYVDNLAKILPLSSAPTDQAVRLYSSVIVVLKEIEKNDVMSKNIDALFSLLSSKPVDELVRHSDQLHRCLTYLIANEEKIFHVDSYLCNPLVKQIFSKDEALKSSWNKFTSGDLKGAEEFYSHNKKYFQEDGLSLEDIKDKMRFYRISQIADSNQSMTIKELSKQLEISEEDVELFLIKAIQYGYVNALIDQMTQEVYFREVHMRNLKNFSKKEIDEQLGKILGTFKEFQKCSSSAPTPATPAK